MSHPLLRTIISEMIESHLKESDAEKWINHPDAKFRRTVFNAKTVSDDHMEKGLQDEPYVANHALDRRNISPKHIDLALDHPAAQVRSHAAGHDSATSNNIEKALKDKEPMVRWAVGSAKNASADQLKRGHESIKFAKSREHHMMLDNMFKKHPNWDKHL